MPGWAITLIVFGGVLYISLLAFASWWRYKKRKEIDNKIDGLSNNTQEMTPKEFFKIRNYSFGGRGRPKYALCKNFVGIYIIYNETKKMYYIGQATNVLDRINNHFTGKGNGDVYADFKYGDQFKIKAIGLENSGFISLNELERNCIRKYQAYAKGYNKTRGNR